MSCGGRFWWVGLGAVLTLLGGRALAEEEGQRMEAEVLVPGGEPLVSHDGLTIRLPGVQGASVVVQPVQDMGLVRSVAYSPDGRILASAPGDETVRLWESAGGRLLRTLQGHNGNVYFVSYSPDGRTLASASSDHTVRLWESASGRSIHILQGHTGDVHSVAYSPDGRTLASASSDHTVRVWETASGRLLRILQGHTGDVYSVAYSPDGRTLASASSDHTVRLWETASGRLLRTLQGHTGDVYSVSYSPDGRTLASASSDETVRLWESSSGRLLRTFQGHTGDVYSVSYSPDGRTLASASLDETVRLWESSSGRLLRTFQGHTGDVYSVSYSPDGRTLASSSRDHTARLWESSSGRLLRILLEHTGFVYSVSYSPDGRTFASASRDDTVRLWETASGRLLRTLQGHKGPVYSVSYSPDGRTLASSSWDDTVRLWESSSGRLLRTLQGHTNTVYSVSYSPDGHTLASASWDDTVRLWDAASGQLFRTLQGHTGDVNSVAYSPDGRTLASASSDHTVRLWESSSGRLLRTLQGHTNTVYSVSYSPDGRTLASASGDDTVRLWESSSGRLLRILQGHTNTVHSVAYSPDGRTLASASWDDTVRLWDAASGRLLRTLQGHATLVHSVSYSSDGRTLTSASRDGTLRLWDARTGASLRILTTQGPNWLLIDTAQRRFWRGDDGTLLTRLPPNDSGLTKAEPVLPPHPTPPAQLTATLLVLDPPGEGADAAGRVIVRVHNAPGAGRAYWLRLDAEQLPPGLVLIPDNQRMRLEPDGTVELQATLSYLSGTGPRRSTAPEPGPHPLQATLQLVVREAFQNIALPPRPLDIHAPQLTVTEPTSALGLRQSAVQVQLINSGNQPSGALTVTATLNHAGTPIGEPVQQQYTPLPPGQSHTLSLPLPAGLPRFARYQLQVEIHGDIWPTHVWQHTVPVRLWLGLVLIAGLFVTLAAGTVAFLLIRPHLDPIVRRVTQDPVALRTISLPDLPQTERVLRRARRFDTARQAAGITPAVWQRLLHATGQPTAAARVLAEAIGAKLGAPIDVTDVPGASAWHLTLPTLHIRFGPATALVLLDGPECERGPARRLAELIDDDGRGPQQVLVLDRTTTERAAAALDGLDTVFVTLTLSQLRDLHLAEDPAQALTAAIVAARPARELSPYHLGHGVEEERQFFGRRAELRRIADGAPHNVLLFGPRQMGKTALLWALERRLAARGDVAFRRVDIGGDEAFKACHGDASALWRLLARKLELDDPPLADMDDLLARLAGTRVQPRWWLLDEVDALLTADRAHGYALGHRLRGLAAEGRAYFVLAGWSALHEAATRERSSPLRNLGELLHLGPLTTEEAHEMLQRPLTTLNFRLQDALADQIIHETGRRPNLLARVGDALIQQALVDEREISAARVEAVLHSSELLGQELNYWRKEPLAEPLVYAALQGEPPTRAELFDRLEQHGYDGDWQLAAESLDRLDVDYVLVPGPDGRLMMPVPLLEHHIRAQGPLDVMIRRTLRTIPKTST